VPLYPIHRQEPESPAANEAHALAAPALLGDAASRADIETALNVLGRRVNELRAVLRRLEHTR